MNEHLLKAECPDVKNQPKHSAVHGYEVGVESDVKTGLQESHWLDGGQQEPSDTVSSTRCDEGSEFIWEGNQGIKWRT
jgi:hypothetical protein